MKRTLITLIAMSVIVAGVKWLGWWFLAFAFISFIGWTFFDIHNPKNGKETDTRDDVIEWDNVKP